MEVKNAMYGILTDYEVLSFLRESKDYPSLNRHVKTYNKLQHQVQNLRKEKQDTYLHKEKISEMERISEVVWTKDTVRRFLDSMPAGSQTNEYIQSFIKTTKRWDEEYELGPGPLSSEGLVLDGVIVSGVHSKADEAGIKLGRVVKVDGKQVSSVIEVQKCIKAATSEDRKYKVTIRGELTVPELVNIINTRPTSPAEVHALISNCELRLSDERVDQLLDHILDILPPPPKPRSASTDDSLKNNSNKNSNDNAATTQGDEKTTTGRTLRKPSS